MSLLACVRACRQHVLGERLPFVVDGQRLGWVTPETARRLLDAGGAFARSGSALTLAAGLGDAKERSAAVAGTLGALREAGQLPGWRGELYAVVPEHGAREAFRLERAAAPLLGVRAFGVHVNAWVRAPGGPLLWVARRSRAKASHPGLLDHLVAGGQPAGLTLEENLVKEAEEEAGLPEHLARRAVAGWPFRYRLDVPGGLRDDTLFVYDLELPGDFEPRALDGEVESFGLWSVSEVLGRLRAGDGWKPNVAPCVLGFLLRAGLLGPDDPEHAALWEALAPARR